MSGGRDAPRTLLHQLPEEDAGGGEGSTLSQREASREDATSESARLQHEILDEFSEEPGLGVEAEPVYMADLHIDQHNMINQARRHRDEHYLSAPNSLSVMMARAEAQGTTPPLALSLPTEPLHRPEFERRRQEIQHLHPQQRIREYVGMAISILNEDDMQSNREDRER